MKGQKQIGNAVLSFVRRTREECRNVRTNRRVTEHLLRRMKIQPPAKFLNGNESARALPPTHTCSTEQESQVRMATGLHPYPEKISQTSGGHCKCRDELQHVPIVVLYPSGPMDEWEGKMGGAGSCACPCHGHGTRKRQGEDRGTRGEYYRV